MTETGNQSFKKYAKILALLRKRKKSSDFNNHNKTYWPTNSSFTLINNIEAVSHDSEATLKQAIKPIHNSARTLKSTTLNTTSPILKLHRPSTSNGTSLKKNGNAQSMRRRYKQKSLFQCFRDEKLVKLQEQKESLLATIFNSNKIEIHRIDEDENICSKSNAINFKTYYSLNKLMDLQEKINETTNLRPKTSCSSMKKKTVYK